MGINVSLPGFNVEFMYNDTNILDGIRDKKGVYFLYNKKNELLYIGRSMELGSRLYSHLKGRGNSKAFYKEIHSIKCILCENIYEQEIYETYAIKELSPLFNKQKTDSFYAKGHPVCKDKSYSKKKAITMIYCVGNMRKLSSHDSLDELNFTFHEYKNRIQQSELRKDLKSNLTKLLERLNEDSRKYIGVSFKRKRKIAEELGVTDRTVTRLCKELESLGMIKQ